MTPREFKLLQMGDLITSSSGDRKWGRILWRCCSSPHHDPDTHITSIRLEMESNREQWCILEHSNLKRFEVMDYFLLTNKRWL